MACICPPIDMPEGVTRLVGSYVKKFNPGTADSCWYISSINLRVPGSYRNSFDGMNFGVDIELKQTRRFDFCLPDQQAKQVAFAIAMKQKQEGMPTSDSFRYSSTGKRTRWIQETMLRTRGKIQERLFNYMDVVLSTTFENMILKYTSTQ